MKLTPSAVLAIGAAALVLLLGIGLVIQTMRLNSLQIIAEKLDTCQSLRKLEALTNAMPDPDLIDSISE